MEEISTSNEYRHTKHCRRPDLYRKTRQIYNVFQEQLKYDKVGGQSNDWNEIRTDGLE